MENQSNPHDIRKETLCKGDEKLRAETPKLLVVTAAVKLDDGLIITAPRPCRHHHLMASWYFHNDTKAPQVEQGFMLSNGSFAGRTYACEVAIAAGQIKRSRHGGEPYLFSEDIW